jgi:hypothetical protein
VYNILVHWEGADLEVVVVVVGVVVVVKFMTMFVMPRDSPVPS